MEFSGCGLWGCEVWGLTCWVPNTEHQTPTNKPQTPNGSYLRLIDHVSLNSRLERNKAEKKKHQTLAAGKASAGAGTGGGGREDVSRPTPAKHQTPNTEHQPPPNKPHTLQANKLLAPGVRWLWCGVRCLACRSVFAKHRTPPPPKKLYPGEASVGAGVWCLAGVGWVGWGGVSDVWGTKHRIPNSEHQTPAPGEDQRTPNPFARPANTKQRTPNTKPLRQAKQARVQGL